MVIIPKINVSDAESLPLIASSRKYDAQNWT